MGLLTLPPCVIESVPTVLDRTIQTADRAMQTAERVNRRVAQGRESRARLLRAATERFSSAGYAGTSVDDVCRSAGIVKSALYWHFESKEGLLSAVLEETANAWIDGILESVQQTGDPLERLRRA